MYCGADHAEMVGSVYVMEPAAYQAWLTGTHGDEAPAVAGARIFQQYSCNTCHGVRAPTLANLYGSKVRLEDGSTVIADDDYIRESIVAPASEDRGRVSRPDAHLQRVSSAKSRSWI